MVDRNRFKPFETTLSIIKTTIDMYPEVFKFFDEYFDKIMGTSKVREALKRGMNSEDIIKKHEGALAGFSDQRRTYLLY